MLPVTLLTRQRLVLRPRWMRAIRLELEMQALQLSKDK